jgi:hypothetical protein
VVKINKQKLVMEEVDTFDNISPEDLAEGKVYRAHPTRSVPLISFPAELPEAAPRYVVLSYNLVHKDGRTSSPLVLINWAPACETSLLTLHASALNDFQNTVRPAPMYRDFARSG